ncbi:MAG: hypothetical protein ACFCD0_12185 [Gemmataceae bacterium]
MTEREWLECLSPWTLAHCFRNCVTERDYPKPDEMLRQVEQKLTPRKTRLFICACTRRVLPILSGEVYRTAVEITERSADQKNLAPLDPLDIPRQMTSDAVHRASQLIHGCFQSVYGLLDRSPHELRRELCQMYSSETGMAVALFRMVDFIDRWKLKREETEDLSQKAAEHLVSVSDMDSWYRWADQWRTEVDSETLEEFSSTYQQYVSEEQSYHGYLLHELFGNPFRMTSFLKSWRTSDVLSVAQAIYDNDRFEQMPILADALEEAGCTNQWILEHCRLPNPRSFYQQVGYDMESRLVTKWSKRPVHVKGCWVLDLILQKK